MLFRNRSSKYYIDHQNTQSWIVIFLSHTFWELIHANKWNARIIPRGHLMKNYQVFEYFCMQCSVLPVNAFQDSLQLWNNKLRPFIKRQLEATTLMFFLVGGGGGWGGYRDFWRWIRSVWFYFFNSCTKRIALGLDLTDIKYNALCDTLYREAHIITIES